MTDVNDLLRERLKVLGVNFSFLSKTVTHQSAQLEEMKLALDQERAKTEQLANARQVAAKSQPVSSLAGEKRGRAAVISWDMGHNPAGRAIVLYDLLEQDWDTELIGPLWSRYGGSIWPPIATSERKMRGIPCDTLEDFWPAVQAIASSARYDLVIVCKPRLPGVILGTALARASDCPLITDIDDFELSFFKDETSAKIEDLEAQLPDALIEPYGELATRAIEGVVRDVPSIIVSNVALRKRYGGIVVRHARDEQVFTPANFNRQEARLALGISADDFALIFVGTPRRHKGVLEVARVLHEMPNKRFVFHIVGSLTDKRDRAELESYSNARVILHPNCEFDALPGIIAAADAVVLLQDSTHPISSYQIPAKISDAAAFGLPVIMTDVPPVRDLVHLGLISLATVDTLAEVLQHLMAEAEEFPSGARPRIRAAFESELSFTVNRARLNMAIQRALAAGSGSVPASFDQLHSLASKAYAQLRRRTREDAPAATPRRPAQAKDSGHDIVMFWKQNDSGLYGRRSDMLMKEFLASGRVRRVLQFDAPQEVGELMKLAYNSKIPRSAQSLTLGNIIDDQMQLRDRGDYQLRSFLWSRNKLGNPTFPHAATSLAGYPDWVKQQMAASGIAPHRALAWVCPVVFDFPSIAQHLGFRAIVGDLIDDQRAFEMSPSYRRRIEQSYEDSVPLFDLAFTNCQPLADAFQSLAKQKIQVVPNGTELSVSDATSIPRILQGLGRPLIGYVGNLRDRIDWSLLHGTALQMPEATFAVVGGGERPEDVAELKRLPNVVFTGIVPYDQVLPVIQSFDVAIMPHIRSDLTKRMNPLKIYNYFAARRPIVSTEVDNIDDGLKQFIRFASGPDDFAEMIRASLVEPRTSMPGYDSALNEITWESRASKILNFVDAWLEASNR